MTGTNETSGAGGKVVGLFLSHDLDAAEKIVRYCSKANLELVLVSADYDSREVSHVAGVQIRSPMDYIDPGTIENLYRSILQWQEGIPGQHMEDGSSLQAASSPPGNPPSIGGWLFRLAPHVHVRIRFIEFILRLIETERPAFICPIGESVSQPWCAALLERVVANDLSRIVLVPPTSLVAEDESWDVWRRSLEKIESEHRTLVAAQRHRIDEFIDTYGAAARRAASYQFDNERIPQQLLSARLLGARLLGDGLEYVDLFDNLQETRSHLAFDGLVMAPQRTFESLDRLRHQLEKKQRYLEKYKVRPGHRFGNPVARALGRNLRRLKELVRRIKKRVSQPKQDL